MSKYSKDSLIKKLMYRSTHRGCKETDIIFEKFANQYLHAMTDEELQEYEIVLEIDDALIYNWCNGKEPLPANQNGPVLQKLVSMFRAV